VADDLLRTLAICGGLIQTGGLRAIQVAANRLFRPARD
jgi:hypothetical protein